MRNCIRPDRMLFVAVVLLPGCANPATFFEPPPQQATSSSGLQVGEKAPDIDGGDVFGAPFRLSDHRGKVVALVFWGEW